MRFWSGRSQPGTLLDGLRTRLCLGRVVSPGDLSRLTTGSCSVLRAFGFQPIESEVKPRLIVVGAGFGGAAAAREAFELGMDVTVLEARPRLGGRARTRIIGQHTLVEEGPQFIGWNHHLMRFYAQALGLHFLELREYEGPFSPLLPAEGICTAEDSAWILAQLQGIGDRLLQDARGIDLEDPTDSPRFGEFDSRTVADWLETAVTDERVRRAMEVQIVANHGVPLSEFSFAAFLLLIRAHGLEQYWTDTEEFVLQEGTQCMVERLLGPLGSRVRTACAVKKIALWDDIVSVTTESGEDLEADYVVLAIPSSVWSKLCVVPESIGRTLVANRPGFGKNIKFILPLRPEARFASGLNSVSVFGDACLQLIWRTTEGQDSASHQVLTAFSGAAAAEELAKLDEPSRTKRVLEELRRIFPDIDRWMYQGSDPECINPRLVDWPAKPLTMGGYCCPRPGDLQKREILRELHPRLLLAGEHMASAWGFMNGAVESGIEQIAHIAQDVVLRMGHRVKV